ncbi:hypothetical protein V5O48_000985 [Marasmius crinis-equi]|uniref:Uncharacterized protein n=1 Tax=Marasmius crinis-equi TaxID=585013 RepID=A0ABR3FZV1_9AGAR
MAGDFPLDVAGVISVWFQTLLYGIYTCLFFTSAYVTLRKRMLHTVPAKVFFVATIVMYTNCTAHVAINLYRLLQGYVYQRETVGPANYFNDLGRWDNIAHNALNALMTWMGDSLIIYRCYLVWGNNIYVIILPTILLIISIVANSIALNLFTKVPLGTIFGPSLVHWMNTIYATAFSQNALTTGLIAYRILSQEMQSRRVGIRSSGSSSSLVPAARIMVDSAAIYMALLLCLIVLYAINHNGQFVMQEASVPAIGIVFCSISLRLSMRSYAIWKTTAKTGTRSKLEWREPTEFRLSEDLSFRINDQPSSDGSTTRDAQQEKEVLEQPVRSLEKN